MVADPPLGFSSPERSRQKHLEDVVRALSNGRLVVFLGAGANICSRRDEEDKWKAGQSEHLPMGTELAEHLAKNFHYPFIRHGAETEDKDSYKDLDLARVAQWIEIDQGSGALYDALHILFDREFPPTSLHNFLASLPEILRRNNYPLLKDPISRRFLMITTNYDDLVERAFTAHNELLHIISYGCEDKGGFYHRPPNTREANLISDINNYQSLLEDEYPILLKVHGAVDRTVLGRDSFVITEDHYLDYIDMMPGSIGALFPAPLPALLLKSHFLFLGYGLRDWNLRIILRRIWRERNLSRPSWSIQYNIDPHDAVFWESYRITILDWNLREFIHALSEHVRKLPPLPTGIVK